MAFYVIWKERFHDGIKNKRVNCVNEQNADNKLTMLKKIGGDFIEQ